jgi:AAHS family 4-hydroxybenzoate transporter-like MFS transporter
MAQFDVEAFIDRQKIGRPQLAVLLVCLLVCFIDGFDIFMIGKIAPAIAEGFGQPVEAMTLLFLCQQIGLAVGAFVVAPLADRFGRRNMLIFACATFGAVTLASVYAQTLFQLSIMRGIAGVFMSAGLPMALAMISEATPKRRRSTFIAIALAGYSTGSAASGAVAAWLIDIYGWQSGFWIGGIVPILCIPLLLFFVPESLKYRTERNPRDPGIARTIRRMDRSVVLAGDEVFVLGESDGIAHKAKLLDVFLEGRTWMTSILWAACFLSMANIALLAAWLPTFFQEMAGIPIQRFAIIALIAYGGGVVGTLTIGYLMDRVRATTLIPLYYIGISAALLAMGQVSFEEPIFVGILLFWSFAQTGGQGGLNTLITQVYPPRMRSTALGWAGGAGRIGGVISPIFGGAAIAQNFSLQLTLTCIAVVPLIVAVLVFMLGRNSYARQAVIASVNVQRGVA